MKLDRFGFANEEAISILENKFEVVLPEDYKRFWRREHKKSYR